MKRIKRSVITVPLLLVSMSANCWADPVAGGNGYGGPSKSSGNSWGVVCSGLKNKCAAGNEAACIGTRVIKECSSSSTTSDDTTSDENKNDDATNDGTTSDDGTDTTDK